MSSLPYSSGPVRSLVSQRGVSDTQADCQACQQGTGAILHGALNKAVFLLLDHPRSRRSRGIMPSSAGNSQVGHRVRHQEVRTHW
jgi:hypothetical protein